MTYSRRSFLKTGAAATGVVFLPYVVGAAAHAGNEFATDSGTVSVNAIAHASMVLLTPVGTIHVDPVGDVAQYADFPKPDLILLTHHHGDHFNVDTLNGLVADGTKLITNPEVYNQLPEELKAKASQMANGDSGEFNGMSIDAIPAYNTTEERLNFHPQGRDNGYVLVIDGLRVYISGDTEDIPEMRALKDIDVAFVCMNLPFTMDVEAAASAVSEFQPKYVYPYHYHGRDGGTQDPEAFAKLLNDAVQVKMGNWYS
ncbi:MBL fold metallo-hydrolase [Neptunicoccus cionae]|uniref:MBL fold metallo-hydrolase n=1 Tax=Neptunicoccus cionae TaxID=2035344 RepID=UPI000C76B773|nr:MBL fold metallo-hydrolase [Amylibacter cionae]PLS23141.1 MBL fold metallo-hydrolase [Amylibacter cionae]